MKFINLSHFIWARYCLDVGRLVPPIFLLYLMANGFSINYSCTHGEIVYLLKVYTRYSTLLANLLIMQKETKIIFLAIF